MERQMWRSAWTYIIDEWNGRGRYLGTGNFSELMLSLSEAFTGIHLLIAGHAAEPTSILLIKSPDYVPTRLIGLVWLVTGCLSLIGIGFYLSKNDYSLGRLFRFSGSLASIFIWIVAAITLSPSPFAYVYYAAAITAMRVSMLVWHKYPNRVV